LQVHGISGLYYKHITIVNYDSSIVNRFGASLTENARGVIYNHHMFIVQATGGSMGPRHVFLFFGLSGFWIWTVSIDLGRSRT
jgi:hypothetical protein